MNEQNARLFEQSGLSEPEEIKIPVNTVYTAWDTSGRPKQTKQLALDGRLLQEGEILEEPEANDCHIIITGRQEGLFGTLFDFNLVDNRKQLLRPGDQLRRLAINPKRFDGGFLGISVDGFHAIFDPASERTIFFPEDGRILTGIGRLLDPYGYDRSLIGTIPVERGDMINADQFLIQLDRSSRLAIILHKKSGVTLGVCDFLDYWGQPSPVEAVLLCAVLNAAKYNPDDRLTRLPKHQSKIDKETAAWLAAVDRAIAI
jgi:hypothetical protein